MTYTGTKTKTIVYTALFSAFVFLFTAYIFHMPIGANGGYIHFGDAFIFIAAIILPFPYSLFVGAIGAGLADVLTGSAIWAPATIVIKPLMAVFFTSKFDNILKSKRNLIAPVAAGLTGMLLYYLYEALLYGNFILPLYAIPLGLIQLVGSAAVYYVFIFVGFKVFKNNLM